MTKRVLLAEDEPNIVASLTFLLKRAGFEVEAVDDGATALKRAKAAAPDLAILDVMLPSLDGFELLRAIRADTTISRTPVIVLTAKGQRKDRERALEGGADLFISKPFSNAEVLEAVNRLTANAEIRE